jgi:hypothetical protein
MTANAGDLLSLNESFQVDEFDDYAAHVAGTNVVGYNCGESWRNVLPPTKLTLPSCRLGFAPV